MARAADPLPVTLVAVDSLRERAQEVVAAFCADHRPELAHAELHHVGATSLPAGHTKRDVDLNERVERAGFAVLVAALSLRLAVAQPENRTDGFASFSAVGYALPLGVQVAAKGSVDDVLLAQRELLAAEPELLRRYDEAKLAAAGGGARAY